MGPRDGWVYRSPLEGIAILFKDCIGSFPKTSLPHPMGELWTLGQGWCLVSFPLCLVCIVLSTVQLKWLISVLVPSPSFSSQKPLFIQEQIIEVKSLTGICLIYLENPIHLWFNTVFHNHTKLSLQHPQALGVIPFRLLIFLLNQVLAVKERGNLVGGFILLFLLTVETTRNQ